MSEIPEDVMKAAREARIEFADEAMTLPVWKRIDFIIARAIMAAADRQREKDAQIALAIIPAGGARLVDPRRDHAHAIAAAIRGQE